MGGAKSCKRRCRRSLVVVPGTVHLNKGKSVSRPYEHDHLHTPSRHRFASTLTRLDNRPTTTAIDSSPLSQPVDLGSSSSPTTSLSSWSPPRTARLDFGDFSSLSPATSAWSTHSSIVQSPTLMAQYRPDDDDAQMHCNDQEELAEVSKLHHEAFASFRSSTLEKELDFIERMRSWEHSHASDRSASSALGSPFFPMSDLGTSDVAKLDANDAGRDEEDDDDDFELVLDSQLQSQHTTRSMPTQCSRAAIEDLTARLAAEPLDDYTRLRKWQNESLSV